MVGLIDYIYVGRIPPNSSLDFTLRNYLLIDRSDLKSPLSLNSFDSLLTTYKTLLFYLDRTFSFNLDYYEGQIIDITSCTSDEIDMLCSYIESIKSNKRIFLLYRPCDHGKSMEPYDIYFELGINQVVDPDCSLASGNLPLAFKDAGNRAYVYEPLIDTFKTYNRLGYAGSLESIILIRPNCRDAAFSKISFMVTDSTILYVGGNVVVYPLEFRRRNIPLILANACPLASTQVLC